MAAGAFRYLDSGSVGADIDGAQAQTAAGFDPLLLQAVVDAGVDVDAAEAEAKAMTVAPIAVVVVMMEGAGGSGRSSGEGEGGGGDQSEGNLAKHCILQFDGREARCFVPAPSSARHGRSFTVVLENRVSGVFRGEIGAASFSSLLPLWEKVA